MTGQKIPLGYCTLCGKLPSEDIIEGLCAHCLQDLYEERPEIEHMEFM